MTSEPIGLNGGLNTYGYALGNPLYYHDFDGLNAISDACLKTAYQACEKIKEDVGL